MITITDNGTPAMLKTTLLVCLSVAENVDRISLCKTLTLADFFYQRYFHDFPSFAASAASIVAVSSAVAGR